MVALSDSDLLVKWKRTRRKSHPDICNCVVEYQYNVLLPIEQKVNIPSGIKYACPAHPVNPILLEIVRGFGKRWFKREDFQRYQDLWFAWRDGIIASEPEQPIEFPTPPQEIIDEFENVYAQIRENMRRWEHAFITFLDRIHETGFAVNLGTPHPFDLEQRYWTEWSGIGENRTLYTHYNREHILEDGTKITIATKEDLKQLQDETDTMFGVGSVVVG